MAKIPTLTLILSTACLLHALQFTQPPAMTQEGGSTWKIEFGVSESTDVEVSIVNPATGVCVRHLAAGVLGAKAPSPLVRSSLSQLIIWDGLDDYRTPALSPENLTVRVRAGMEVRLDKAVGGDPYLWGGASDVVSTYFYGITQGSDGSVFLCFQPTNIASNVLRQYSATGEYVKTLFPIPGDKTVDNYTGWGLNLLSTTSYTPKTKDYYGPLMSTSPIGTLGCRPAFVVAPAVGQLGLLDESQNTIWVMNEDGTCDAATAAATKPFVNTPARYLGGPRFFTGSPDRSFFLMSGVCSGADTGFYRDGRIFKVDRATHTASLFFDLGSAQTGTVKQTYIHGTAIDDSGYVFACDRLNNRIMVIDKNGTLVKSISAQAPDDITYCKSTGVLYATGRKSTVGLFLYKIADWRSETSPTITTRLLPAGGSLSYLDNGWYDRTYMTTSQSPGGTLVWLAYRLGGIVLYQESGGAFTVYKSFRELAQQGNPTIKRIAVDTKTETAYLVSSGTQVHKIADWNAPAFVPCSTRSAAGTKAPLMGFELTVDPLRRHLLVRQIGTGGPFEGDVNRFSIGQYLTPAPLTKMATNTVVDSYCVRGTMSVGTADFGIAVAPNGHVAVMSALPYIGLTPTAVRYHPVYDTQSVHRPLILINDIGIGGGGVSFDLKGNLYVGKPVKGSGAGLPSVITGDLSFTKSTGTIQRYNAAGSLDGDLFSAKPAGPDKIYDVDLGQLGGGTSSLCDCMTASFGMDLWGRLYVPNGPFQKISVLDNEGNRTLRFGSYGNISNVADESAGAANTEGKCYMAYPFCVAATDDYIYATDPGNVTVTRFKKRFLLDNVPTLSIATSPAGLSKGPLALSTFPNPFLPQGRFNLMLPASTSMTLDVVDLSGRIVKRIASGVHAAGPHSFTWNAFTQAENRSAAGIYFLRLKTDKGGLTRRFVLAR